MWVNSILLCSIWLELCPDPTFRLAMYRTPNSWQPVDSDKYTDRDIYDRTCMFCCIMLTWTQGALPMPPRYKLSSAEDSRQSSALCVWQQKYDGRCQMCISLYCCNFTYPSTHKFSLSAVAPSPPAAQPSASSCSMRNINNVQLLSKNLWCVCVCVCIQAAVGSKMPYLTRMLLRLIYTDISKHAYSQSWIVSHNDKGKMWSCCSYTCRTGLPRHVIRTLHSLPLSW